MKENGDICDEKNAYLGYVKEGAAREGGAALLLLLLLS